MENDKLLAKELQGFPGMVRWFSPLLLLDTARHVIASALFGQYADRRLIHAALDAVADDQCAARSDFTDVIKPAPDGSLWVDFVADLGDGFDSTYAIAYLLSRPALELSEAGTLPRGHILIMGGDEVYPTATRDEYDRRMERPYEAAFPDSRLPGADHPFVFLIPGNHDWYDGLVLFLAKFCRGRPTPLGSWRATQHRSYFAIRLSAKWWIWGIDTQLTEDIDRPQASYFVSVARSMPENAKIILCSGVPSWLKAEESGRKEFYRSLDYIACIAKDECKNATICAVLSGDTHHYSRYSADGAGTQFITAGGGGAFLHPTHFLKDTISASWVRTAQQLSLKTAPGLDHGPTETQACYPSQNESRRLLWRNLKFIQTNPEFCFTLGGVYWLAFLLLTVGRDEILMTRPFITGQESVASYGAWMMQIANDLICAPNILFVVLPLGLALWKYAAAKTKEAKAILSISHTMLHFALILVLTSVLPPLNAEVGLYPGNLLTFLLMFAEFTVIGGFAGGFVWGIYLLLACWRNGLHYNDAFSAMRLNCYRHFLRMRIKDGELTIYPIGLDETPSRNDWGVNPKAKKGNQNEPIYLPIKPLQPHLIEGPITIRALEVKSVVDVAANA